MSRKYLTGIDLSQNQIANVALQNLAADPSTPVAGQIYYNTGGTVKYWNGSSWITFSTGTVSALTFNNSGTGATSGTAYTGGAMTVSYNTIGAAPLASPTFTGVVTSPTFTSTQATGTAPFTVSSTTLVANLNANLVNGLTTASTNTVSTVVARDASGNFAAGTITANLTGTASFATTANAVALANVSGLGTGVGTALGTAVGSAGAFVVNGGALGTPASGTLTNATGYKVDNLANTGVNVISFLQTPTAAVLANTVTGITGTGASANLVFSVSPTFTGTFNAVGGNFTGTVTVPTPVNATDAANKKYVDDVASGVNAHDSVRTIFTTTIAGTYTAGSTTANPPGDGGTGLGATITFTATGATVNDTSVTLALYDRVLVTQGVTASTGNTSPTNGIYVVTTAGTTGVNTVLTRALDYDNSIFGDVTAGDLVFVSAGTTYANTQWIQTNKGTATTGTGSATKYCVLIGTDAITFTQFAGALSSIAGNGLIQNGSNVDVNVDNTSLAIVADVLGIKSTWVGQTAITTLGSITTGTWSANAVGVLYGGTGATTAAGARTNLSSTAFGLPQKFAASNGALTASSGVITWPVTHNLGTTDVVVMVYTAAGAQVETDVVTTSTNVVTLTFNSASLTGSEYRVVVIG